MPRIGSLFWSEEYKNKAHTRDDEYVDAFDPAPPGSGLVLRLLNYAVVLACCGLMVYYTTLIVGEYHEDLAEPPTVTGYKGIGENAEDNYVLNYPTMIICPSITNAPLTLAGFPPCVQDQYDPKKKRVYYLGMRQEKFFSKPKYSRSIQYD